MMRTLLLALLLATGTLAFAAGPVDANTHDTCAEARRVPAPGAVVDTVPSGSHFYRNSATALMMPILIAFPGTNVDLYVKPANCGDHVCRSGQSGLFPDLCIGILPGNAYRQTYEVRHVSGPGEYALVFVGLPATNPGVTPDLFGSHHCYVYNDEDNDVQPDSEETLVNATCRAPNVQREECRLYDDANTNGVRESSETLAGAECPPFLVLQDNGDGTCTLYADRNGNGQLDPTEEIVTFLCPSIKPYRDEPNRRTLLYDDRDRDNFPDDNEILLILEDYPN